MMKLDDVPQLGQQRVPQWVLRFTRTRLLGPIGLSGLLFLACGSADSPPADSGTAVQFETSGEAVAGAVVIPLIAGAPDGEGKFFFGVDPNNDSTTTGEDGTYNIDYEVPPPRAGVEITIAVPGPGDIATGNFSFRTEVDIDAVGTTITIPQPTRCESAGPCGDDLLPDLTPIVSTSGLGPTAAERLTISTDGPRSADLFPDDSWFIDSTSGRRLLRFPTVAANIGTGPLDVIAEGVDDDGVTKTFQRIWTNTWHFRDVSSGEFVYHPTHEHIHFDAFERYELLDESGTVVIAAEKVSFCLRDSVRISEGRADPTGVTFTTPSDCGETQQVINPGFGDHYHSLLDDQWIDITDVAPGNYTVRIIVDPLDVIVELDESNNVAMFDVVIDSPS